MSDNKYQGWTNRETWCVALWMDNEQHTQTACMTLAQETAGAHEAARLIEEYVEGEITAEGMQRDLINCCLARCNWIELVEHFRAE